jgi:hypothetical protein
VPLGFFIGVHLSSKKAPLGVKAACPALVRTAEDAREKPVNKQLGESALRKRVVGGSNPSAGIGEAIDPVTNML